MRPDFRAGVQGRKTNLKAKIKNLKSNYLLPITLTSDIRILEIVCLKSIRDATLIESGDVFKTAKWTQA